MALSRLVRKQKKTSSAKELIEAAMRQAIAETPPMSPDDWLRISSLGSICPREEVLRYKYSVPRTSGFDPNSGMTFEYGHDIHYMMQNKVMAATGMIVGSWRCVWCAEVYGSIRENNLVPRPSKCIRCGGIAGEARRRNNRPDLAARAESFLYVEEWMGNSEFMVGGSPDGFFVDGDINKFTNDDVIILEFKSASENNFAKFVKAADFMHVIQCQCYMWITGFKRAKIIYVNKAVFGMDGIVEHDIVYDYEQVVMVQSIVKELRAGLAGGALPVRVACDSAKCPRANACDVSRQCFAAENNQ